MVHVPPIWTMQAKYGILVPSAQGNGFGRSLSRHPGGYGIHRIRAASLVSGLGIFDYKGNRSIKNAKETRRLP